MNWTALAMALPVVVLAAGCGPADMGVGKPAVERVRPGTQGERAFKREITRTVGYRYLLFLPKAYEERAEPWPMMLFLHGAGERGDDLSMVKRHGPPKIVETRPDFPFVLVSPQCPPGEVWDPQTLNALVDEVQEQYRIDADRIYVTGLSMGGYGTWSLATEYPKRFAAIAPICGGGTPLMTRKIVHLPTWVFHGAKDPVVPLSESQRMVDALKRNGGDVKFTIYPEAGHDAWTEAYNDPKLYEWFLAQRRKP